MVVAGDTAQLWVLAADVDVRGTHHASVDVGQASVVSRLGRVADLRVASADITAEGVRLLAEVGEGGTGVLKADVLAELVEAGALEHDRREHPNILADHRDVVHKNAGSDRVRAQEARLGIRADFIHGDLARAVSVVSVDHVSSSVSLREPDQIAL